jgi:hypothetical protein
MNGTTPEGLAVHADLFADRTEIAPVGADAAAACGQPHVLVPQPDDALEAVVRLVEEARDRQAAACPPLLSTGVAGMNQRLLM